jgi:hypothetical protein
MVGISGGSMAGEQAGALAHSDGHSPPIQRPAELVILGFLNPSSTSQA